MEQLIDFHAPEVQAVLDTLLKDRSTGKNIIWATDPPEELQTVMYEPVTDKSPITAQQLGLTHYEVVLPRMMKQTDTQQQRTRKKGEVFSPAWVCNKMNNALDADWFGGLGAEQTAGQFTVELPQSWQTVETPVQFPACGGKTPAWVQYLLNFFPVIGEDEEGEMIPLDAEKVLSIPRKIKSKEVVRMGFQSNFLFQNISNVFSAPQEVLDILQNFQPISEAKAKPIQITPETGADLSLNDKGEVDLDEGYVIGKAADVFGAKIYESTPALDTALQDLTDAPAPAKEEHLEPLKKSITKEIITPMVEQAKQEYGRDLKLSDQKRFESATKAKMDVAVNKVVDNYRIDQSQLETQRTQQLQSCTTAQQRQQVNREFDAKQQQSTAALMETLQSTIQQTAQEMQQTIVRTVETNQKEQEKKGYEDTVRDHLRGFSRTIPSFLMAYGDETVTLANFDRIIPDKVFQEVTSITLEQFRFLRDGGPYINQATGQEEHFAGHLFDPVVFDDSVKEFLNLKVKLADYFDESRTEDIFDYIPPQKTNQIFTPKWVVKKMVDLLEQENPGCFDDPGKTFLDPYMKSGLYITEIVKRLYRSEKMRQAFPDDNARLEHIFAKQVYGLAPTEIIYRIAISYILGFAKGNGITAHHIRQADTLEFAKAGTMERELDKIFRD